MDSPPRTEPDTTTTGRNPDDPVNLGDGLKYQELTARVQSIETSVAAIKSDIKTILGSLATLTKSQPSTADIASELWKSVSPIIIAHRKLADQTYETYMAEIRNMVDARYNDTHADIQAIKGHLLKTTGSAPTTILRDEDDDEFTADDAKKGESGRDRLPKLDPFGCPPSKKGK